MFANVVLFHYAIHVLPVSHTQLCDVHSRFLFLLCHPTHNTILIIITETKYDKKIMREKLCHSTEKQTYKHTHTLTILQHHSQCKDFPYYLYKYAIKKGKRYLPKKRNTIGIYMHLSFAVYETENHLKKKKLKKESGMSRHVPQVHKTLSYRGKICFATFLCVLAAFFLYNY